jgi:hypothetical protein
MSDQKLSLQHKLFAAVERMVRDTPVHDANLRFPAAVDDMDFSIDVECADIEFHIPADITGVDFVMGAGKTHEIVEQLTQPAVIDAGMGKLEAKVIDEKVDTIENAHVHDEPIVLDTDARVTDFFKQHRIKPGLLYSTTVKGVSIPALKPIAKNVMTDIASTASVKENLFFFRRLIVRHKPVVLSFMTEKEQLVYWKWAVSQTGKEAKKLAMVGVFTGVPYDYIENIKINYSQKRLFYNFRARAFRPGEHLKDVALFNDLDTNKTIVVMAR